MNKIFMLAFANIRKSKSQIAPLIIMIIIASTVLNISLLMLFNYNSNFTNLCEELNASDAYITLPYKYYTKEVDSFVSNHENIEDVKNEVAIPSTLKIKDKDKENTYTMLFFNNDHERDLSKKKFIGEHLPLDDNSIYIGYYFNIIYKYKLNDTIFLDLEDGRKEYTIKGFVEDIYFSSPDMGMMDAYFIGNEFNRLCDNSDKKTVVCFANLYKENASLETDVYDFVMKNISGQLKSDYDLSQSIQSVNMSLCKSVRTIMANIVAAMMIVFSAIIVIICMIIIRFRINNSIEDDMIKIGSLKAAGYTSKQIVSSMIMQFSIIACISIVIGIALSYPMIPFLSDVLARQSALKWEQGFDLKIALIVFTAILSFVLFVSFFTARRIRNLHPIIALRGGVETHSFRKNYIPLDRTKGPIPFSLGIKSLLINKKQSVMICIISIAISFSGVFALLMFYNSAIDNSIIAETSGQELADILVKIDSQVMDNETFLNDIKSRQGVEMAQYYNMTKLNVEGISLITYTMENFDNIITDVVYKGNYPKHDNEIAINGNVAKLINKEIGDTVTIKEQEKEYKYLITGFNQGVSFGGKNALITYEAYNKINSDFKLDTLYIYLKDNQDVDDYINQLTNEYGDVIISSQNFRNLVESTVDMYADILSLVGVVLLIVSILIIILVLYFILNSFIIRNKRQLGVQKAIGFTTLQLMNQISFSVMPVIIVGTIIGCVLGKIYCNPIMSFAQSSMGTSETNYIVLSSWVTAFCIAMIIISYIASMLITRGIRKISAYALVTE